MNPEHYEMEFYEDESGSEPCREFIDGLPVPKKQAIRAALLHGEIRNAVNMPNIDAKTLAIIGPYLDLAKALTCVTPSSVRTSGRACSSSACATLRP